MIVRMRGTHTTEQFCVIGMAQGAKDITDEQDLLEGKALGIMLFNYLSDKQREGLADVMKAMLQDRELVDELYKQGRIDLAERIKRRKNIAQTYIKTLPSGYIEE